jgi:hypothetical protein
MPTFSLSSSQQHTFRIALHVPEGLLGREEVSQAADH